MLLKYHRAGVISLACGTGYRLKKTAADVLRSVSTRFARVRPTRDVFGPLAVNGELHRRVALPRVRFGNLRRVTPISRVFGFDRGLPIDRYYVERFLSANAGDIRGNVLEVGDNSYTRRFGGSRVIKSDVLHIEEGNPTATIVADLACAEHVADASFDCIILTQTLHLIYDVRAAVKTLYRILKPGEVLLATFPGLARLVMIAGVNSGTGDLQSTRHAGYLLKVFPESSTTLHVCGNVLVTIAFLHGLAAEELREKELNHHDPSYQLSIMIRTVKPG